MTIETKNMTATFNGNLFGSVALIDLGCVGIDWAIGESWAGPYGLSVKAGPRKTWLHPSDVVTGRINRKKRKEARKRSKQAKKRNRNNHAS